MLVEVLAGADAEEEAARQHRGGGRGGLGDDRRVDAEYGARDAGADRDSLRRLGDAPEDAPDERALALAVDPGVEVIRDQGEVKSRLLGTRGVAD